MSAVEDYRKFKKDHPASPCGALGMKADAAITEMEAKVRYATLTSASAEAELAALKARRCETCRRGDDDQGKDKCLGTLLKEASMCNKWEARP